MKYNPFKTDKEADIWFDENCNKCKMKHKLCHWFENLGDFYYCGKEITKRTVDFIGGVADDNTGEASLTTCRARNKPTKRFPQVELTKQLF